MQIDDADLILGLFPRDLLNFTEPPPGQSIGPLHAIFKVGGQIVKRFYSDELLLKAQLSVQNAAGKYLDLHGYFYGVLRLPNEQDDPYRARILDAITAGKLTLFAIKTAVQNYYASIGASVTVDTYDLQSDPARCAAIGDYVDEWGGVGPIVIFDFVIDLNFALPADDFFFLDWGYLDENAYLFDANVDVTCASFDNGLTMTVRRTKAADTHPVYRLSVTFTS